jgi:DNA primase
MTVIERAIAYLRQMPGAVSGSGGHRTTFEAAQALVVGFVLDPETAFRLLREIHNPLCSPRWSDAELRHKVASANNQSKRERGYLLGPDEQRESSHSDNKRHVTQLDPASYANVANRLLELCPFVDDPETLDYCDRRILIVEGAQAQLGGLPPPSEQGPVISKLLEQFGPHTLARAGLLKFDRESTDRVDTSRFAWPHHRLVIPWRGLDGTIDVLQRRRIDADPDRKYVFPSGKKPLYPFGIEALASSRDAILVICEGALDVLALHRLNHRACLGVVPIGIPGLGNWRADWARFGKGRWVRIGVDADAAGDDRVRQLADDLWRGGATRVTRWRPEGGKDWSDVLLSEANHVRD